MKDVNKKVSRVVLCLMALTPTLVACELHEPGNLVESRLQIQRDDFSDRRFLSAFDEGFIETLGRHYSRYGDGAVRLTLTYDPASKTFTALKAKQALDGLVSALKKQGVADIEASILPIRELEEEPQVLVSYQTYTAKAPAGCGNMSGYEDTEIEIDPDYRLGCTVEGIIAQQVARPADLKGKGQEDPTSDGRRSINVIEGYRAGMPNKPLEGETASE